MLLGETDVVGTFNDTIVDVAERWPVSVSMIDVFDTLPIVTISEAASMDALNVRPPVALLEILNTTRTTCPVAPVSTLSDKPLKL